MFVGTATGLRAALLTRDALKGDDELKPLWNSSEAEAEVVWRFIHLGATTATLVRRAK